MADIVQKTGANLGQIGVPQSQFMGASLVAGEDIAAGDACYIKNSDKLVWRSVATDGTTDADQVLFYSWSSYKAGQQMTVVDGPATIGYSDGTAPVGKGLFLSNNAGKLRATTVYATQKRVAYVYPDGKRIRILAAN